MCCSCGAVCVHKGSTWGSRNCLKYGVSERISSCYCCILVLKDMIPFRARSACLKLQVLDLLLCYAVFAGFTVGRGSIAACALCYLLEMWHGTRARDATFLNYPCFLPWFLRIFFMVSWTASWLLCCVISMVFMIMEDSLADLQNKKLILLY